MRLINGIFIVFIGISFVFISIFLAGRNSAVSAVFAVGGIIEATLGYLIIILAVEKK